VKGDYEEFSDDIGFVVCGFKPLGARYGYTHSFRNPYGFRHACFYDDSGDGYFLGIGWNGINRQYSVDNRNRICQPYA
jgi:hypothetical protein